MIIFNIPGKIKGKGRARFTNAGKFMMAYTPKDTVNYENWVKYCYLKDNKQDPHERPVYMCAFADFARPKAHYTSKGLVKERHLTEVPIRKPDSDNIIKVIADALNGIAYKDDAQIVTLLLEKRYSESLEEGVKVILANSVDEMFDALLLKEVQANESKEENDDTDI